MDDAVLDELYAAPLDEFIALRTSLAKQLKADGRGDEAAEVGRAEEALRAALGRQPARP